MRIDGRVQTLRMASAIIAHSDRAGPGGLKSSLGMERGLKELPDEKVIWAIGIIEAVRQIEPPQARRAVGYTMSTDRRGNIQFSRKDIAQQMGISERTVSRLVAEGLAALDRIGAIMEMDRPPKNTACVVARTEAPRIHI